MEPGERLVIKVKVGPNTIDLIYDTGSQFTIITRKVYESLDVKPPLVPLQRSGISITWTKFNFDGVAYLNLEFQKPDGSLHTVEYEPILSELRFEETRSKQQDQTLTFVTAADEKEIVVPFYKETEQYVGLHQGIQGNSG